VRHVEQDAVFQSIWALLFGRPARRGLEKVGRLDSLQELYEIFGRLLPQRLLAPTEKGPNSRERLFTPRVTFWAFAAQVLSLGTACREIVRRIDAWWQELAGAGEAPSGSTSAYCQARAQLVPRTHLNQRRARFVD